MQAEIMHEVRIFSAPTQKHLDTATDLLTLYVCNTCLTCEHPTSLKLPPLVFAATQASANVSIAL
jgi:hypothetical protein